MPITFLVSLVFDQIIIIHDLTEVVKMFFSISCTFSFSGWSFILAVVGAIGLITSAALFLTEANVQHKKLKQLNDSQARFELERASKS